MRILFLGRPTSPVLAHLRQVEETVEASYDRVTLTSVAQASPDFIVSHGCRQILRPYLLDLFPDRVVNLHIAYLPWNRGADPHIWSAIEGTPSGVTIHYVDKGIDTGDIIAQREVMWLPDGVTVRDTYELLQAEMLDLFVEHWPEIRDGSCPRYPQEGEGSFHRVADLEHVRLPFGKDTRLATLRRPGLLVPGPVPGEGDEIVYA